jgi:uncharacterized repeat protein (TIGR01451 family)
MRLAVLVSALLVLLAGLAYAQQEGKSPIELSNRAEVEVVVQDPAGAKVVTRVDAAATKVVPGTEVIFTTGYRNLGTAPVDNAVIVNPVPENTVYVSGSAEGEGTRITFSVDGGKTYDVPARLTVTGPDGTARQAGAEDYTHVRWEFTTSIPAGAEGSVAYRAIVE